MRFIGIDPSTKTGFVAVDEHGQVLKAKELTGVGDKDPRRMITLIDESMNYMRKGDQIAIEGFGFATQQGIQLGGIGWGIRMALVRRGFKYYEVAPNAVKKFVGATGWTGEVGNKKRLTGPQKKKAVMAAVQDHYGFSHKSDNIVDAYILAQIARLIYQYDKPDFIGCPTYQAEVVATILGIDNKRLTHNTLF
ncbi:hypothetical protein [Lysinibacillus piscis]|uniref:Uncharacterized protein n=1 Tax=Lysinibacillus piscis TaxID=2518931 RepID=A0ABQ5NLV6_9BACI|nr:hypothetical protein [Lysinibacillus sp. KH24]GLC89352.1 hypothetical protein LYSBPC_24790 [Lysinibacillus sp. KH24]